MAGDSGSTAHPGDPGVVTSGLPHEWAAIAEATARLRQRASRAIGASVRGDLEPVSPHAISLEQLQLGRNAHEAHERLPFVEHLTTRSAWSLSPAPATPVPCRPR